MPGNYSGVPNGTPQGMWIQTGGAGSSNVSDYNGVAIYNVSGRRLGPNEEIPPGATISMGSLPPQPYQSSSAVQVQSGTQPPLDNAAINLSNAQATATLQNANTNATQAANQAEQNRLTAARNAQLHDEFMAKLGLDDKTLQQQYEKDVASIGVEKANLLLNSRIAQAKVASDRANFMLSQNQFNAQQRQEMGRQQLDALKMLADRQGPQDWTRWDYITGQNGQAPTPDSSKTYSPLDMIASQYEKSNIAPPADLDMSGIDFSSIGANMTRPTATTYTGTTQPAVTQPAITPAPPATPPATTSRPQSGTATTSTNLSLYPSNGGSPAMYGTNLNGQGAASIGTTMGGNPGNVAAQQQGYTIMPDGTVRRLAEGGVTGGAAIVGDSKSGKKTGYEELAYAAMNPKTNRAELHVVPLNRLAGLMDTLTGATGGQMHHMKKLPPELAEMMMPHAADGGVYDGNASSYLGTMGGTTPVYTPPKTTGGYLPPDTAVNEVPKPPNPYGQRQSEQPEGGWPTSLTNPVNQPPAIQPTNQLTTPATSNAAPTIVGGQIAGNANAAPPPVSLGPAGYDPYRITQNHYDANTMNNSPVLKMIRGQAPVYGFTGYGDYKPGVQSQGITDLPIHLNYGDLLRMDPNRLAMLKGLYDNPETGISWDSILAMAKKAAPTTGNFGVSRAR